MAESLASSFNKYFRLFSCLFSFYFGDRVVLKNTVVKQNTNKRNKKKTIMVGNGCKEMRRNESIRKVLIAPNEAE